MKTKLPKRVDFAFAVGKIRSLEIHLIRESLLREMLDIQPFSEALTLWAKIKGYPEDVLKITRPEDIDLILRRQNEILESLVSFLIIDQRYLTTLKLSFQDPNTAYRQACILKNDFLKNYIRIKVDLIEIKTLFREKGPKEVILSTFKNSPYYKILNEGLEYFGRAGSFSRLEKLMDDYLIEFIRQQKYNPFGPEPVLAYYLARINEFNMLRLVFCGRILGLENKIIADRINQTYV